MREAMLKATAFLDNMQRILLPFGIRVAIIDIDEHLHVTFRFNQSLPGGSTRHLSKTLNRFEYTDRSLAKRFAIDAMCQLASVAEGSIEN